MLNRHAFALVAFSTAGLAQLAFAAAYDSAGFESPRFTSGAALEGQDAPPAGQGPWVRTPGAGSATIQTAVVHSGTQAVRVNRAGQDVYWAVNKPESGVAGTMVISWDMNVTQATHSGAFGPFFAIQAYDAVGSSPLLIGSAGIDAKTGEFLYQQAGTGFLTAPGPVVPFGTWNHFEMHLNYATDRYSVFLNGNPVLVNEGFVDDGVIGEINDFSDASIAALAAAGDPSSLTAPGTAYFDNYAFIPEPSALSLLGSTLLLAYARRGRSR